MILFAIADVPGSELGLHPNSWGTIFGPNFHTSSRLGCGSLGFHRDLSTSHRNMPGLVSEPALLKTWSAADASPSPALHNSKTFRSPDLTQAPCLPKALIPVSLMSKHLPASCHPWTLLAQFTLERFFQSPVGSLSLWKT